MLTKIVRVENLIGKTIKAAHGICGTEVFIVFDDSYAKLTLEVSEDVSGISLDFSIDRPNKWYSHMGICSEEEAKAAMEAYKQELDKRQEEQDRLHYERLKAKFGG